MRAKRQVTKHVWCNDNHLSEDKCTHHDKRPMKYPRTPPKQSRPAKPLTQQSLARWSLTNGLSTLGGLALAIIKVLMGAFTISPYLAFNGLHGVCTSFGRIQPIQSHSQLCTLRLDKRRPQHSLLQQELFAARRCAALIIVGSLAYLICGIAMLTGAWEMNAQYGTIEGITVATIAFTELGIAIGGLASRTTRKSPSITALKAASLSSALISISLAQAALLSFASDMPTRIPDALGCITMASASLVVGALTLRRFLRMPDKPLSRNASRLNLRESDMRDNGQESASDARYSAKSIVSDIRHNASPDAQSAWRDTKQSAPNAQHNAEKTAQPQTKVHPISPNSANRHSGEAAHDIMNPRR